MNRLLIYFSQRPLVGLAIILVISLLSATQIGNLQSANAETSAAD